MRTAVAPLLASCVLSVTAISAWGCGRPGHVWEAHIYATPIPESVNVSSLGRERILTLLPASYNQLQGYIPMVSHALMAACAETHPPLQLIAAHETFNKVNQQPLIQEYTDQDPTYAPSHLLDENRLKQLGSMLGVRYLLQPGFAYVTEDTEEKFEVKRSSLRDYFVKDQRFLSTKRRGGCGRKCFRNQFSVERRNRILQLRMQLSGGAKKRGSADEPPVGASRGRRRTLEAFIRPLQIR